jgi:hypothetical protein
LRYNINPFSTAAVVPYGSAFSQAPVIYHSPSQSTSVSSFTIPSSNDNLNTVNVGAPVLQFGHTYSIAVELDNTSGPAVPFCQLCNVATRSVSWFDYTPINPVSLGLPATAVINLPTTQPIPTTTGVFAGPVYSFNAPIVTGGGLTFIDPLVAYGYIYTIGTGNPNFASVEAVTNVGTGVYQLLVWNGTKFDLVDSSLKAGDIFNFLTLPNYPNGVTEFEILLGVDQGVNPTDITAFVTGLTFTGGGTFTVTGGNFTGTMVPLVVETVTPLPTTWILMLSGIIGLGFLSYRNRKRDSVDIAVA